MLYVNREKADVKAQIIEARNNRDAATRVSPRRRAASASTSSDLNCYDMHLWAQLTIMDSRGAKSQFDGFAKALSTFNTNLLTK